MKRFLTLLVSTIFMLVFFHIQPGFTQTNDEMNGLKEDIKAIKDGQTIIQKDLQEIKKLLSPQPAAQPAGFKETIINIQGAPFKGDDKAKLVFIEFSDYVCPFCGRFVRETMPQIEKEYIETGKMKHVFMDFPLAMHKNAFKAAEAGLCAKDQGKFWEMHDRLFANQNDLGAEDLIKHAEALALDTVKFKECLDSGKHSEEIRKSMAEGQKAVITGTPAFLFGFIQSEGKVKSVKKIVGAQTYDSFKSEIDELLSSQ